MRIVLDENVCLRLKKSLRALGHEVECVTDLPERGISDEAVWEIAKCNQALLITRDYHFTNPIRFNPSDCGGVLFLRHGNLTAEQEEKLVCRFLSEHAREEFAGRLVSLSLHDIKFR